MHHFQKVFNAINKDDYEIEGENEDDHPVIVSLPDHWKEKLSFPDHWKEKRICGRCTCIDHRKKVYTSENENLNYRRTIKNIPISSIVSHKIRI
jgi:hypothetical protein